MYGKFMKEYSFMQNILIFGSILFVFFFFCWYLVNKFWFKMRDLW